MEVQAFVIGCEAKTSLGHKRTSESTLDENGKEGALPLGTPELLLLVSRHLSLLTVSACRLGHSCLGSTVVVRGHAETASAFPALFEGSSLISTRGPHLSLLPWLWCFPDNSPLMVFLGLALSALAWPLSSGFSLGTDRPSVLPSGRLMDLGRRRGQSGLFPSSKESRGLEKRGYFSLFIHTKGCPPSVPRIQ